MKQQALILDYLSDRLSEEARRDFEAALADDPDLAKEVELQKVLLAAIDQDGDVAMKKRLAKILPAYEEAQPSPATNTRRRLWPRWIGAIAAIGLLLFVFWPGNFGGHSSPQEIYAQQYEAYELSFGVRGEVAPDLLQLATTTYQQKKYSDALPVFKVLTQQSEDGKFKMALGICQLEDQQYREALQTFQTLIELPDLVYEQHAIWYSALTHLQLGETQKAASLLQLLAQNTEAFKHQTAVDLLKEKVFLEKEKE